MFIFSILLITGALQEKHKLSGWKDAGVELSKILENNNESLLLFDERKILTPFLYYLKPWQFNHLVKWNIKQEINDHYDLTTDMNKHLGRDFIYVSRWNNMGELLPFFENVIFLEPITVKHGKNKQTILHLAKLKNFKGYDYEQTYFSDFLASSFKFITVSR